MSFSRFRFWGARNGVPFRGPILRSHSRSHFERNGIQPYFAQTGELRGPPLRSEGAVGRYGVGPHVSLRETYNLLYLNHTPFPGVRAGKLEVRFPSRNTYGPPWNPMESHGIRWNSLNSGARPAGKGSPLRAPAGPRENPKNSANFGKIPRRRKGPVGLPRSPG